MLEAKYCKYLVLKVLFSQRLLSRVHVNALLWLIFYFTSFSHIENFQNLVKDWNHFHSFFPHVDKFRLYESQPSGLCKRNHYRDKRNCFHLFACSIKISFRSVSYSGFISCKQVYRDAGAFNRRWRILILIQNIHSLPAKELIWSFKSLCEHTHTTGMC